MSPANPHRRPGGRTGGSGPPGGSRRPPGRVTEPRAGAQKEAPFAAPAAARAVRRACPFRGLKIVIETGSGRFLAVDELF